MDSAVSATWFKRPKRDRVNDRVSARAVAGIKSMTKARQLRQAFGQFDHRFMRQTGQHHVVKTFRLGVQRSLDVWMTMTKQIDPPRAHRIQITFAIRIKQPDTFTTNNGHQGL